jgi:hypothetical protein
MKLILDSFQNELISFEDEASFLSYFPPEQEGKYRPQPSTTPDTYPCYAIMGQFQHCSNGADIQHIALIEKFVEPAESEIDPLMADLTSLIEFFEDPSNHSGYEHQQLKTLLMNSAQIAKRAKAIIEHLHDPE